MFLGIKKNYVRLGEGEGKENKQNHQPASLGQIYQFSKKQPNSCN